MKLDGLVVVWGSGGGTRNIVYKEMTNTNIGHEWYSQNVAAPSVFGKMANVKFSYFSSNDVCIVDFFFLFLPTVTTCKTNEFAERTRLKLYWIYYETRFKTSWRIIFCLITSTLPISVEIRYRTHTRTVSKCYVSVMHTTENISIRFCVGH